MGRAPELHGACFLKKTQKQHLKVSKIQNKNSRCR
jgi:hypothetical protein